MEKSEEHLSSRSQSILDSLETVAKTCECLVFEVISRGHWRAVTVNFLTLVRFLPVVRFHTAFQMRRWVHKASLEEIWSMLNWVVGSILWYKSLWRNNFPLKNVTSDSEGTVTGGSASSGGSTCGGPRWEHWRRVTTHRAPVVLQFAMTTEHFRAVDQRVFLAFFQVKKSFFIIAAFRFSSLGVDFCHNSLNDVYL